MRDGLEFGILGPLEARRHGEPLPLGRGKQRALLARLLLERGRPVSAARLVEDLWGAEAPETAAKMVQVYVSQLRKVLPAGVLETRPPGYLVDLKEASLDLDRAEKLLDEARAAARAADAASAADALRQALELWRGLPLSELTEPFAAVEGARLEELRLTCLEERIEADLQLGRHAAVASELAALVERNPLREGLVGQLMRALYGTGRQAEALEAYRTLRERLDGELGMEPSRELKELERRILRQDPALERQRAGASAVAPSAPKPEPVTESEIRYARSGDVRIAYEVVGDGAIDLVLVHGWICTFQPGWENPRIARFYRRLASMGRLILFDKRGTGLSDRVGADALPDLETRMDDVRAVMDAAGSERAVLVGVSEGAAMSLLFAATYPERTAGLVLLGAFARLMRAQDYAIGQTEEDWAGRVATTEADDWARVTTMEWLQRVAPAAAADERQRAWYESYVMRGASPSGSRALRLMNREIDVRHVLPAVAVPTLVAYRAEEWYRDASRHLGERLPHAQVVELPGNDHLPWEGDQQRLLDEIERFLSQVHEEVEPDRVLVSVLFADVVGSTQAAALGGRRLRELLDRHHAVVRAQIGRFRGREIDTGGEGVLAVFDGPARAVRCAVAVTRAAQALGIDVRAGVHTGEVERTGDRIRGIALVVGAGVAAEAGPGEVLVSGTVRDLVAGSGLEFDDRGELKLPSVPGEWRLLALRNVRRPPPAPR